MKQTKECEICGVKKPVNEFSKSYRNCCKKCVAEQTRLVRAEVIDKARTAARKDDRPFRKAVVKDTGEIVMVRMCCEPVTVRTAMYETQEGRKFPAFALEHEKIINWEQRRYEIARSVLAASSPTIHQQFLMHVSSMKNENDVNCLLKQLNAGAIETSIALADALIAELKKGNKI